MGDLNSLEVVAGFGECSEAIHHVFIAKVLPLVVPSLREAVSSARESLKTSFRSKQLDAFPITL